MANRTFDQWINGIFNHSVAGPDDTAWYWSPDADTCEEENEINVVYLTRLFVESDEVLRKFNNAQVNQGLNLIVNGSCSNHSHCMMDENVLWPARRDAIRAIFDVYAKCFALRCDSVLSHGQYGYSVKNTLNTICYMWWDVFPMWGDAAETSRGEEAIECIDVMKRCLSLSHLACIEGALHGLGHWESNFPQLVRPIIDQFLSERNGMPPELLTYAGRAREGAVL
jgi:hypothetical protein